MSKKVSVKDIASHANVSIGTVDRVIHERGEVSAKTARRVKAVIEELGYEPNLIARSLATKNTHTLAVFLPDSKDSNDYWHYPIVGIKQAINEISDHGINLKFYFFDLNDKDDFLEKYNRLISDKPDVVITAPMFEEYHSEVFQQFEENNIKYVLIDSDVANSSRISFVGQHTERSGQVAGRLMCSLLKAGENTLIANILSGSDITPVIQKRIQGFRNYMMENNSTSITSEINLPINLNESDELTNLIASDSIKGIFVPGSRSHIISKYLDQRDLNDIKIIGYDLIENNIQDLKAGKIDLIISQRPLKQGYHAVMRLFDYLIKKQSKQENILLPIDVILKENVDDYLSSIKL